MKKRTFLCARLALTAISFGFALPLAHAAIRTWSGAGADANWTTPANWGGTAPVNADNLIFTGTTQQNNTNSFAALSSGWLALSNGGFTLNSSNANTLSFNGPLTNAAGTNILALNLNVVAQNAFWFLGPGSELRVSGNLTNAAAANPLATVGGGGALRITSPSFLPNRFFTLTNGTIIIDGGTAATVDGFRLQPPAGGTAVFQITNNGSLTIGLGGNLRLGQTATGGSSRVDMSSGILNLAITTGPGAGDIFVGEAANTTVVFNQNGGLVEFTGNGNSRIAFANASASANGTYNLNGGTLWTAQIVQVNAGAPGGTFNFNGGTLKPLINSTTFFQGVQNANIQSGGAIIDTTNLNVTIGEPLPGVGGLTKLGTGTLTLTGNNTYTGMTTVSNGTLVTSASSFFGSGAITVANNANLTVNFAGAPLAASTLNAGSGTTNSITLNFGSSPSPGGTPVISVTNLNGTGTVAINISGSGFTPGTYPLIAYTNITGVGAFQPGSFPAGLSGTLVQSGNALNLVLAAVPKNLAWSGNASANWDTSSFNWFDLNNGNNLTNYSQSGSSGDAVTFDDNGGANPNVNLSAAVTPSQLTFNNNGVVYTFSGTGKISGDVTLVKGGFQPITLGMANDYSGGTVLNAGTIYLGADGALGTGPATLNLGGLASDGPNPRTLPNTVIQNANTGVTLGDSVNTGTLTLAGGLNLGGAARTLSLGSDVIVSGSLTNGGIGTKLGAGSLIVAGQGVINSQTTENGGNVIINGGQLVQTGDGWRMQNTAPGSTMDFAVTNGGSFIMTNLAGGNLRVGLAGEDVSTSYILDVAGRMVVLAPANPAGVGQVLVGVGAVKSTVNLWPGGNLICGQISSGGTSVSEMDFYGGTLTPTFSTTTFLQGLTSANLQDGGLTVDTTNLAVTIAQPLLAAGTGGLTKVGSGTLTLTGTNTYTGATMVNAGKLVLGPAHASPGGTIVNANSILAFLQSAPPATVNVPSVTIGSGTNSALEADLFVTNAPAAIITNLVLNGSVAVNVTGSFGVGEFPLFGYGSISGPGGLTVGNLPLGTVGSLVTNTSQQTIDLVVSSVAQTLWTGAVNGNWNTTTTNWTVSGTPVAYAQGANVLFNDSANNSTLNLITVLTPNSMVISNNALAYTFSGTGSLGGTMSLAKDGTNNATLTMANTYTGPTTIDAGTITLGNATALGAATATVTVQNGASLDLAGNAPGLKPLVIGGTGVGGNGALVNDTADQNNALRAVTLTSNTVIRADSLFGIRTSAETDPGFSGNGFTLTKTGANGLNLNGGQANVTGTMVWDSDLGDINVQQGRLSFERRMTMGRVTNTITVFPGAVLQCFALNTNVLPLQAKPIHLMNATLAADVTVAGDFVPIGCPVAVDTGSNSVTTLPGTGTGAGEFLLEGPISGLGSVSFSGTNELTGTNIYTGNTVIASGTLQLVGTGSIADSAGIVVQSNTLFDVSQISPWTLGASQTLSGAGTVNGAVQANGTLAPGNGTGTLTVNGNLTIAGNVIIEVNKSLAQSNDMAAVFGSLNNIGTGSVIVTNLGTALAAGDTFVLFNQPVANGGALTVTGAGVTWTNNLAVDGSISVLSVVSTSPVTVTNALSGTNLNLSWPADHTGWRLLVQTNSVGGTNWATWPGSAFTNAESIPIDPSVQSMFFRLVYP